MLLSTVAKMSFALEVKKEISNLETNNDSYKAELYAITKLKANLIISFNNLKVEFVTNNNSITRRIIFLIKKLYEVDLELLTKEQNKLDKKKLYYIVIKNQAREILYDLDLIDENLNFIDEISNKYDNYKDSILRGMFLAKGSINDPNKINYHLEIVCNYEVEANYLVKLFSDYGINASMVLRRKGIVVYIKKSEHIGDFLKIIGSTNALFYFENERIKKDLNNVVNRVLNCDIANSDRTQMTALKQLEAIKTIEDNIGFSSLSKRLQDAIQLRRTYPESSLSELSENSEETIGKFVSKSGISHCLKDIENIAKAIKDKRI